MGTYRGHPFEGSLSSEKAHPVARKWNFLVDVYAVIEFSTIVVVLFSFGISFSLYQSPIWIKVSLVMQGSQRNPFPTERGPENLRLLAVALCKVFGWMFAVLRCSEQYGDTGRPVPDIESADIRKLGKLICFSQLHKGQAERPALCACKGTWHTLSFSSRINA
jgi:hypothetical protein